MLNYEILEKLTRTIGVSGEEDDVRSVILSEIEPYADEIHISPLGNILAFKKGEKRPEKKLMLCAHMDEVGFVITNITENGLLKFTTVGNIRPEVLSGRDVLVGGKTPGVICAKPVHLLKGDEFEKPVPVNENGEWEKHWGSLAIVSVWKTSTDMFSTGYRRYCGNKRNFEYEF